MQIASKNVSVTEPLPVQCVPAPELRNPALLGDGWGTHIFSFLDQPLIVTNPATNEQLAVIRPAPFFTRAELTARTAKAQRAWARTLPFDRASMLRRFADLMAANREDLASLMTLEQGKPIREARGEIDYAASFLNWFAGQAERLFGDYFSLHLDGRQMRVVQSPLGVVGAFTPWNFPSAMITRKAGAALAAGCAMMTRPAPETPLSALALAALAKQAGIPEFVFSIVLDDGAELAENWSKDPLVRGFTFTGSTQVGKTLLAQSAATVKRTVMELGGHAPFIVFSDASIEMAVKHAINAKFATSGQDCLAVNRIYVERPSYGAFCEHFTDRVSRLHLGHGIEESADIGPLIGPAAVLKCQSHVDDAVARGASVTIGGGIDPLGPHFFQPTVLKDVTPDSLIWTEETFGPVAAIAPFDEEASVFSAANQTEYGLAAYLMTQDKDRIFRASEALEFGMIGVNASSFTGPPIPFGGIKQSGVGREGGESGIREFLEQKYICETLG